jgi:hypothetical protein
VFAVLDGTYQWTFGADGTLTAPGTVSAAGNVNANTLFISGNAVIVGNANIQGTLTYNDITNLTTDNLVLGLGNNQVGIDVTGGWYCCW